MTLVYCAFYLFYVDELIEGEILNDGKSLSNEKRVEYEEETEMGAARSERLISAIP